MNFLLWDIVVGTLLLQNLQEMKAGNRSKSNYQFFNPNHHPQGHTSAANWGKAENSNVRRVDVKFFWHKRSPSTNSKPMQARQLEQRKQVNRALSK